MLDNELKYIDSLIVELSWFGFVQWFYVIIGYLINVDALPLFAAYFSSLTTIFTYQRVKSHTGGGRHWHYEQYLLYDDRVPCSISTLTPDGSRSPSFSEAHARYLCGKWVTCKPHTSHIPYFSCRIQCENTIFVIYLNGHLLIIFILWLIDEN